MDFIFKNYILIIIIVAFLIFAVIGYLVDNAKNGKNKEEGLFTRPNDEVDINLINQNAGEPAASAENVTSAPTIQKEQDDLANLNKKDV